MVVEDNTLKIVGVSQWGESYDISGLTMDGGSLTIEWNNSIGEHGVIQSLETTTSSGLI